MNYQRKGNDASLLSGAQDLHNIFHGVCSLNEWYNETKAETVSQL